jgi:F-type H+-transporting ATPase subunit b
MDKTLHDLGGIILEGLPTFFLVFILAFFVRQLYLKPLDRVLEERYRRTEGAGKEAERNLRNADHKIAEYRAALSKARMEIYQEEAVFLQKLHGEQTEQARATRDQSDARVAEIKIAIAKEADEARESLEAQAEGLAGRIADVILARRNAA